MTTLLAEPLGKGYVRAANEMRVDVPAHQWADTPGTDYWLIAGSADLQLASALAVTPNVSGLDSYYWTVSTLSAFSNLVTADFISSADDTPPNFNGSTAASADAIFSPIIFGNYSHALLAGQYLGYVPTKLVVDFYASFPVNSADETTVYIGLHNGSAVVAAVSTNGTNFRLRTAGTEDVGQTDDASYHHFRIAINRMTGLMEWFVDGVSQGTLATSADAWPAAFNASKPASTNTWGLAWAHIFYE